MTASTTSLPGESLASTQKARPASRELRITALASLSGGLGHVIFFVGSSIASLAAPGLASYTLGAAEVTDYRAYGLVVWVLTSVWALGLLSATVALGRLVWEGDSLARAIGSGAALVAVASMVGGQTLAMMSAAGSDLVLTGANVETQAAVLQGAWIGIHGGWYATAAMMAVWLTAFGVAAYRTGLFRVLGLVLTLLAVASVVAIVIATPYPTSLPLVSLYYLVLGMVLLVRARRLQRDER